MHDEGIRSREGSRRPCGGITLVNPWLKEILPWASGRRDLLQKELDRETH